MGEISSGEITKVGGTDIHLPAIKGTQDEIFKNLFGPLAVEIGKGLVADYKSSNGEELSTAETDNLRRHADAVREQQTSPEREPTRKQRKRLFEWIDEASETNPDISPEESAKWQAVLSEILGRNDQASLEILKSLNTYDVEAISNLGSMGGSLSNGETTRLISLGIVEERSILKTSLFVPAIVIGILTLFPVINTNLFDIFFNSSDVFVQESLRSQYQLLISTAGMFSFFAFGLAASIWVRESKRVFFTPLGRDIKRNIDRFV
ncbi:MAG: hypothetical protein ABJO57_13005 [Lentilitoribacter sp.]